MNVIDNSGALLDILIAQLQIINSNKILKYRSQQKEHNLYVQPYYFLTNDNEISTITVCWG
jgi:hypothetical protein